MVQAIKLGPANSICTYLMNNAETRMIRGFSLSRGKYNSGIGNAEKGRKWWAWKDSNLRPADYESDDPVHLMNETGRILRGFSMQVSVAFETRAYPETRSSYSTENELEFMASVFPKASHRKDSL